MSNPTPLETNPSQERRLIPLRLLRHDEANVRGNVSDPAMSQADAELLASIKAHGLLKNLVVTPRTKTLFGVAAGARRLRALQELARSGDIPKNHPVPCLVIEPDAAAESSLVENAIRVAMHPADQVRAFRRLADDGATAEEIATRFGMAERTVQKRLRLGGLADEILDAYRAGELRYDAAEAFATTADADFQRTVFESLKQRDRLYPHDIRHALSQRHLRSDSPIATFVGLDTYRAAGGAVEDPLFEEAYLTVLEPDLMHQLATSRLQEEAARYADDWKWTEAVLEFTWAEQQRFHHVAPLTVAEFTPDETAELQTSEETAETIEAELESVSDPARRRELLLTLRQEDLRAAAIERARTDRNEYADVLRTHAGVVVSIDDDGYLEVNHGLVRTEDVAAYQEASDPAATPGAPHPADNGRHSSSAPHAVTGTNGTSATPPAAADPEDTPTGKKNGGYSDALRQDLRIMRTAALRRALARNPDVATDLIGFVLARLVDFGPALGHRRHDAPLLAIRKDYQPSYPSDALKASAVMKHLEPTPDDVDLSWLQHEDAACAFRTYRSLADDKRASVLAHAVAALTVPHLGNDQDVSGAHEQAATDLGIDFPAELAAIGAMPFDPDIVWNRMTKGMILDAAAETVGSEWARNRAALKKKDLVAAAAAAFRPDPSRDPDRDTAASRWMPPGFDPAGTAQPTAAAAPDTPETPDTEGAAADPDTAGAAAIPAFLTQ